MIRWKQRARAWLKNSGLCDFRGPLTPRTKALIEDLASVFERIHNRRVWCSTCGEYVCNEDNK
jgi:hypothetical protein